jgi:hypothetical protein
MSNQLNPCDDEVDGSVAMMEKLMDESWAWEEKCHEAEAKIKELEALLGVFTDMSPMSVGKTLYKLTADCYSIGGCVDQSTGFMRKFSRTNGNLGWENTTDPRHPNPWDSWRKAKTLVAEFEKVHPNYVWHDHTPADGDPGDRDYYQRPRMSRNWAQGPMGGDGTEGSYRTLEWLDDYERFIGDRIRQRVNDNFRTGRKGAGLDYVMNSPMYRRAQRLCIAKDIRLGYKWCYPHNRRIQGYREQEHAITVNDMKAYEHFFTGKKNGYTKMRRDERATQMSADMLNDQRVKGGTFFNPIRSLGWINRADMTYFDKATQTLGSVGQDAYARLG